MGPPQRVMWHCDLKGLPPSVNHDKKARSWWIWWAHSIQCKRTRVRYTLSFPVRGAWKDPCTVANNTLCNGLVACLPSISIGLARGPPQKPSTVHSKSKVLTNRGFYSHFEEACSQWQWPDQLYIYWHQSFQSFTSSCNQSLAIFKSKTCATVVLHATCEKAFNLAIP